MHKTRILVKLFRNRILRIIGVLSLIIMAFSFAMSVAFAIVYIPVPSYTMVAPSIAPGIWISAGSAYGYYTIGFATALGTDVVSGTAVEPLPILNPDLYDSTAPTNPFSPLVTLWAYFWDVPVNTGWIVGSMFLVICTFIAIAYKFQHIGFATMGASTVLGFFSIPAIHILPQACLIIAVLGVIAGVVVESRA